MKKLYKKPQVYMEQFEMSAHIAACKITPQNSYEENCVGVGQMDGYDGYISVFTSDNNSCVMKSDDEACLFTQAESTVSFNS